MALSAVLNKTSNMNKVLFLHVDGKNASYINACRHIWTSFFGRVATSAEKSALRTAFVMQMKLAKATHAATTSKAMFEKVTGLTLEGTKNDNLFTKAKVLGTDVDVILIPDLITLFTRAEGDFLLTHSMRKLIGSPAFLKKDTFDWKFLAPENFEQIHLNWYRNALLISVDIETQREGLVIDSVAYTALFNNSGKFRTETVVLKVSPDTIDWAHQYMKEMNRLPQPKIMQNGMYDAAYFLRFNAPLHNWLHDTYHMMHCMFAELPKDLAFISSFFLDNFIYWKDEVATNRYEYNAKDTHNTMWVYLAMHAYIHHYNVFYAKRNYVIEFTVVPPALSADLEGIAVNLETRERLKREEEIKAETARSRLEKLLGLPGFNPGSPTQVKAVMNALGWLQGKQFTASDKMAMQECLELGPIQERIINLIREYRAASKAISNYYESELLNGRFMYHLDPGGTETGRSASKGSPFWCGSNIQNQPAYCKEQYEADEGWLLFEVDKSQAESWCTGYLAQDSKLMKVLHESPDFHCTNASLFFGIPFEELFDVETGKKLNKEVRNVAKRVNHGANYNMGAFVLWQTMGTAAVFDAARLLKLPSDWDQIAICNYLLQCFDQAYPRIRNMKDGYYAEVVAEVMKTGMLVGPTGWTRRTFLNPQKSKPALNALVAHPSQSLNVMLVNIAWKRVYWELQQRKYKQRLRIKAQIHDSLFGQVKDTPEASKIVKEIEQIMRVPVNVHGRQMIIPGDVSPLGKTWSDIKD